MTEVRVSVERDTDDALCCPRCVAITTLGDAPDLRATLGEHDLPRAAIQEPRPKRESVPTFGYHCDEHDVLLPLHYNAVRDCERIPDDLEDWISVPIRTHTDSILTVAVPLAAMIGDCP